MKNLSSKWKSKIPEDEREEFEGLLLNAKRVLDVLALIIQDDIKESESRMQKRKGYESPNWAYQQADEIGNQRALMEVLKIIQVDKT